MGGFEAEGEGGYWENDQVAKWMEQNAAKSKKLSKNLLKDNSGIKQSNGVYSIDAHAKVNIFLKITGHQDSHHTLLSRFMRVEELYDSIAFVPCECETFTIEGCEGIPLKSNTIYKAYRALNEYTGDLDILNYFYKHKVVVTKRIPAQAGLGGGSSDAAAFMRLVKEVCNLLIGTKELAKIGSAIGADIPFFIYNYPSANVSGFGEVVEPFDEPALTLSLYTPDIGCDTSIVYKTFKEELFENIRLSSFIGWDKIDSKTLLSSVSDPTMLNDLYAASLIAYPDLKKEAKEGWYFSGSGSTFFTVK